MMNELIRMSMTAKIIARHAMTNDEGAPARLLFVAAFRLDVPI